MSRASRATCRRSALPVKRPALSDPKVCDRLTVPVDADPRRLRRHGASDHDLDLRGGDLPQLRYVLQVDCVWHRCGKADMKLHQKVGRDFDVESLGEVRDLQPWSDAAEAGGVGLQDAGGARREVLAEVAEGVNALPYSDRDAGSRSQLDVTADVLGRKRFCQMASIWLASWPARRGTRSCRSISSTARPPVPIV